MDQLAGKGCLFCNERIDGDFDSAYCSECGYPRHNSCVIPEHRRPMDRAMSCLGCGSSVKARNDSQLKPQFAETVDHTSLLICPMCGILNSPGTIDCQCGFDLRRNISNLGAIARSVGLRRIGSGLGLMGLGLVAMCFTFLPFFWLLAIGLIVTGFINLCRGLNRLIQSRKMKV